MAKVPVTINQLPAHLQKMAAVVMVEGDDPFDVEGGLPIGLLSLKGKVFTRRLKKDKEIISITRGTKQIPVQELDVLFIGARPGVSKTYYIKAFEEGSDARPDCASIDGITPDIGVPHKQNETCHDCKWNKFGTALQGGGKRCGDNKRVAVLPCFDPLNEDWGGPMLMRIPPSSFGNFMEYATERKREGGHLTMAITRLSFDPEAPAPKLMFEFQRWLDEDETEFVLQAMQDPRLERVLSITQEELHSDDTGNGDISALPEEEVTPAAQQRSAAAEKLAAARTQAKAAPTATAKPVAAKPNGGGKPVIVTAKPAAPKPAPTVVAMPKPAPKPAAIDPAEAKRQRLAAILAEAEALDAELNPENENTEPAGEDDVFAAGEELEEEAGSTASTDDLMGEIDAELGALPDDE